MGLKCHVVRVVVQVMFAPSTIVRGRDGSIAPSSVKLLARL